eukprot:9306707-Karenia_brevis.AAC.1
MEGIIAVAAVQSKYVALFPVLCGVIQGDPISSILFVIAKDPTLHMFNKLLQIPGHAVIRCCADD